MNEQLSATSTLTARSAAADAPEDAWDRLAALTFGDAATEGGCSEHTHDCTCLAVNGSAEVVAVAAQQPSTEWPKPETESAGWSLPPSASASAARSTPDVDSAGRPSGPEAESVAWPDAWSVLEDDRAWSALEDDRVEGDRAAWSVPGEPPAPDPERPADPEAEPPLPDPGTVPPDPERPVFPDSEPEPTPPLEPEPSAEPASESGV